VNGNAAVGAGQSDGTYSNLYSAFKHLRYYTSTPFPNRFSVRITTNTITYCLGINITNSIPRIYLFEGQEIL